MTTSTERRPLFASPPKPIILPPPVEDELERAYQWLATRGITRATAQEAGVIAGMKFIDGKDQPAIGFPYGQPSKPYAVKWRAILGKGFTQDGGANTLWLSESLEKGDPITITEGEADCLALRQVGIKAVSVPNGAPSRPSVGSAEDGRGVSWHNGGNIEPKYRFLAAGKDLLEAAPKVILAVDGDEPGNILAEELARRVGRGKCWRVLWPEGCKDANDTLIQHGGDVLRECVENAQPWPVNGLYDADHFFDKVEALYLKGLPKGESTGFPNVDDLYTVLPGQLTIATGSPGSGKSTFIDNMMVNLAKRKGWRFAVCSFENPPHIHIAKLMATWAGKPFFDGPTPRMAGAHKEAALEFVKSHFTFLHQADGSLSNLDDILDLTRTAILRHGIRGLVIDPYNFLDRGDSNETDWVSDALTKLKVMAMAHDLHIWLVAHPFKMRRKEDGSFPVPTGYDIAGSAHFFNKADMGITIHRPDMLSYDTEFHSWKVRFSYTGKVGKTKLGYDVATGSYFLPGPEDEDF